MFVILQTILTKKVSDVMQANMQTKNPPKHVKDVQASKLLLTSVPYLVTTVFPAVTPMFPIKISQLASIRTAWKGNSVEFQRRSPKPRQAHSRTMSKWTVNTQHPAQVSQSLRRFHPMIHAAQSQLVHYYFLSQPGTGNKQSKLLRKTMECF